MQTIECNPSHCPFCGKSIAMAGSMDLEGDDLSEKYTDSYDDSNTGNVEDFGNIQDAIDRAKSITLKDMRMILCQFCTNDFHVHDSDPKKVKYCPYCREKNLKIMDKNAPSVDLFKELTKDMSDTTSANDIGITEDDIKKLMDAAESVLQDSLISLKGHMVGILLNEQNDPIEGVCTAIDIPSGFIRIELIGGYSRWLSLDSIQSIDDLGEDHEIN